MTKKLPHINTPHGVTELIQEEVYKLQSTTNILGNVFSKKDFHPVVTPTIEYFDVLSAGLSPELSRQTIKFFDQHGHTLMLRSDFTTPIARIAASRFVAQPMPIKLHYQGPVFRSTGTAQHEDLESYQAGIEIIGNPAVSADAEAIVICIEGLLELGFSTFGLDIGHVQFIQDLSPEKQIALSNGDYVSLGEIPKRGGQEIAEEVPDLIEIYHTLRKLDLLKYVQFTKGLYKNLDYYTGTTFNCYIKGMHKIVAAGGRYDALIGRFGYPCPAVGFAYNINALRDRPC